MNALPPASTFAGAPDGAGRPRLAASMARRRASILEAAVALFRERGYLGATMDDIAERAGVTKRTLYHHMQNKENILVEIHSNVVYEGLERWEAVVEQGGPPLTVLRALIGEHVAVTHQYRDALAVFFEEGKHLSPQHRTAIAELRGRYERVLREVVAAGVASGDLRSDLDPAFTTRFVLGGLTEMYRWYKPGRRSDLAAVTDLVQRTTLGGLRGAPGVD